MKMNVGRVFSWAWNAVSQEVFADYEAAPQSKRGMSRGRSATRTPDSTAGQSQSRPSSASHFPFPSHLGSRAFPVGICLPRSLHLRRSPGLKGFILSLTSVWAFLFYFLLNFWGSIQVAACTRLLSPTHCHGLSNDCFCLLRRCALPLPLACIHAYRLKIHQVKKGASPAA